MERSVIVFYKRNRFPHLKTMYTSEEKNLMFAQRFVAIFCLTFHATYNIYWVN